MWCINIRYFHYLEKLLVSKIIIKINYLISISLAFILFRLSFLGLIFRLWFISIQEIVLEWEADFSHSVRVPLLLVLDWISLFFISVVSIISARVFLYSRSYIATDVFYRRFILLVLGFVIRIRVLIFSPNFIRILLGWDGLGVTSFLLVVYYQREKSFNAGIITALTNRLGDVGLLLIIGCLYRIGRFSYLFLSFGEIRFSSWLAVILILAASTKSAQLPFSAWLPAAIAAPTPVSSLVHSSTLVTAGVYLLIRINYLLRRLESLWVLMILGAGTILMAGIRAIGEVDIKKIIALSTLRQLGLIFITLGIGLPILTFFHLSAHAYFKAIIFICAGGVIHRINEYQDTRVLGASSVSLPVALRVFLVGNLSLCGLPFITGFFSKDLILELIMISRVNAILFLVAILATFFTVAYSLRIIKIIFFTSRRVEPGVNLTENRGVLVGGMIILLAPAVIGGLVISWTVGAHTYIIFLPAWLKLFILIIIFFAVIIKREQKYYKFRSMVTFIFRIWFIPFIFRRRGAKGVLVLGKMTNKIGENGWNSILGYKFITRMNLLGKIYFRSSIRRSALKRVWFIIAACVLMI